MSFAPFRHGMWTQLQKAVELLPGCEDINPILQKQTKPTVSTSWERAAGDLKCASGSFPADNQQTAPQAALER